MRNLTSLPNEVFYKTAAENFGLAAVKNLKTGNDFLAVYYATKAASYYLTWERLHNSGE